MSQRPSVDAGDRAAAAEARAGAGRPAVSLPPCRICAPAAARATRNINTRCKSDNVAGSLHLDAEAGRGARAQFRYLTDVSSDQQQTRARDRSRHRSRHRVAARHHARADRQHALRRFRPAAGLGHLQRDQSVSRRDGDRSALHAISRSLSDVYVATSGGGAAGTATSNLPGGHRDGADRNAPRRHRPPHPPARPRRPAPTTIRRATPPPTRSPIPARASPRPAPP